MKKYICIFALTVMSCGSTHYVNGNKVKAPTNTLKPKKVISWAVPCFFLGFYLAGSY